MTVGEGFWLPGQVHWRAVTAAVKAAPLSSLPATPAGVGVALLVACATAPDAADPAAAPRRAGPAVAVALPHVAKVPVLSLAWLAAGAYTWLFCGG